jgi:hypothetical protein
MLLVLIAIPFGEQKGDIGAVEIISAFDVLPDSSLQIGWQSRKHHCLSSDL